MDDLGRQQLYQRGPGAQAAKADARERRVAESERIRRCPDCQGGHWVLDDDGTPADPAVRCTHPKVADVGGGA
jgi:hypothetical protein